MNRVSVAAWLSQLLLSAAAFTLLFFNGSEIAFAQSIVTGDLTGTVTDPSGAVVAGANVTLKSVGTGATQVTPTNSAGVYRFVLLKPGAYRLTVSQRGFNSIEETVAVAVGQVTVSDLKLDLGASTVVLEVTGKAPLLENENANLATTFSTDQLEKLPVPGNDITSYAYSAPGMVLNSASGYGNFSSYGLPTTANLFTINGGDMNDPYLNLNNSGASNLMLGANELDQVAIVSNGYTAQYGRQAGAQLNATTKSGSNAFHGNAEYWWNGRVLNANDWFSVQNAALSGTPNKQPFANNNQWAASIGGPIKKDKLFFFVDNEGLRFVLPGVSGNNYLPTPAFANYVLSNVDAKTPGSLPFYQKIFNLYAGSPGAGRAVPVTSVQDTSGGGGCGDFAGTAGFGGAQPCAMFFTSNQNNLNTEWLLGTRIDYNISNNDRLFGRFWTDHGLQATGTDPINSVFNQDSIQPQYAGQINHTHVFNGTTVNQLIVGGSWYSALFTADNLKKALQTFPTTISFSDGLFANIGGTDNGVPQGRIVSQYQIVDDFSKTIGTHDFKFGVNFRRNLVSDYTTGVNTSGLMSINSMTEFVNGSSQGKSDFSRAFANEAQVRIKLYNLGFYGQDQWKATSKLSLTAALRIDRTGNPACASNCFSRLISPFADLSHNAAIPYNQTIITGLKNAFPNIENAVLAPRMGIAYSPNPNTVIRGGAGIFSDLFPATIVDRFIVNAPNVTTFDASNGAFSPDVAGSLFAQDAASNAAFQSGFANGATLAQLLSATNQLFTAPAFNSASNRLLNPKWLEYNLEVERQLSERVSVSANYVGNHGYDIMTDNPYLNAFSKSGAPFGSIRNGFVSGVMEAGSMVAVAPDPRFNQVRQITNLGWSNYNGLTTSVKVRTRSLQTQFNYTWSHNLDTCSNNCLLPFSLNTVTSIRYQSSPLLPGTAYGNSDYDVRHNISANYVYDTKSDWSNGLVNHVVGGWTVAGTVYYHSGYPWSPVSTAVRGQLGNVSALRSANTLAAFAVPLASIGACSNPNNPCATLSDFVPSQSQSDFGNYARNSLRGPSFFDTDLNLTKNFKVTERMGFAIGASFFNILNHPNFDLPLNNAVAGGGFGTIVNTVAPATNPYGAFLSVPLTGRIVQLNGRFNF